MDRPLVTVILPCFNAEKFIFDALNSIINQSYKNLEIFVINDGSTDSSIAEITSLLETDTRVKLITNEVNLGLIKTLNKGIDLAKGKYIARMDADDFSAPGRIEKQINTFLKNPSCDVLGTNASPMDMEGNFLSNDSFTYLQSETLKLSVLFTQPFFHGSVMAKTNVLKENHYSEKYKHSEDFELWNRLSSKNYNLANLKDSLYTYRINTDGVSRKFESTQIESHNLASKHYLQMLLSKTIDDNVVAMLNNRPIGKINLNLIKISLDYFNLISCKVSNNTSSNEVAAYRSRQRLDILIQCFISSKSILVKSYCIQKIIFKLYTKESRNYVKQKIAKYL
ncbi:MAG: glycosyltransferase involved in cell wall biosynthesis [Vicingaceae bacterium]|jgi:glycosyltransferase involved in cell wall biosynthesis